MIKFELIFDQCESKCEIELAYSKILARVKHTFVHGRI